jgi:hypothetical protein
MGTINLVDLSNHPTKIVDTSHNHTSVIDLPSTRIDTIDISENNISLIDKTGESNFVDLQSQAIPETILPFRVMFTNIDISAYSSKFPAPIGIAIIGLNNYIL